MEFAAGTWVTGSENLQNGVLLQNIMRTGKNFEGISVDRIPAALRYFSEDRKAGDLILTESQIAVLEESVKNALANPLTITQSQYTTAP